MAARAVTSPPSELDEPTRLTAMKDVSAYELISAYLDGELSDDARAEAERLLVENVEYRRWFQQLKAMRGALASLPKYRLEADFAQKVLRRAELVTLQGTVPEATGGDQESSPTGEQPQTAPSSSSAGAGSSGVEGTGAASRNGRSSARWDAPLWIAVAASVCIYISLAGREASDQHEQVAMQRQVESGPQASGPRERSFQDHAAFSYADDASAVEAFGRKTDVDDAAVNGSTAPNFEKAAPASSRFGMTPQAVPGMEVASPQVRAQAGDSIPRHADEANVFRGTARMPEPAAARESAAMPADPVAGTAPANPASAVPFAPGSRLAAQPDRAEVQQAPADMRSLAITNQSAEVTPQALVPSEVLICETQGNADKLIAQFEAALTAEAIALDAPPQADADDNPAAKRQSDQPTADGRETDRGNRRAQLTGPAQEEVRVYIVEASDEQLTRLKTRLQQLPDTSLQENLIPQATPQPPAAPLIGHAKAGASEAGGIAAQSSEMRASPAMAAPAVNRNAAELEVNRAESQQAAAAGQPAEPVGDKAQQAVGSASRRAVFILRAPRETP